MQYDKQTKDNLLRALVTKICETKEYVDVRWDKDFFENNYLIYKKINDRKSDIPSLQFLEDTYKFAPYKTEYTLTDIVERLHQYYYYEKSNAVFKRIINERKNTIDVDPIVDLDNLNKEFGRIRSQITNAHVIDVANEPEKVADEYRKLIESVTIIPTGIYWLDEVVAPKCGSFLMLIGVTGAGKSLLMTYMQKTANDHEIPSLYISLEMTLIEQVNRLLALKGICTSEELMANTLTPEEYQGYVEQLKASNTHILTRTTESRINLQTIERYISELKPRVVFLDYMTLLQDADFAWNSENPVSAELKRIALQYDCLMVTAIQADTSAMTSGDVPDLHNARGNKGFSHDANAVVGFASSRYQTDPEWFRFSFSVRKNRNGGLMDFIYKINPNKGIVYDITKGDNGPPVPIQK